MLESMSWPGNGRQLKAFLKRLRQLFDTDEPTVEHLQMLTLHERSVRCGHGADCTQSPRPPQIETLAHLRRTATALHSAELLLKALMRKTGHSDTPAVFSDLQLASLHAATSEIRALIRDPILFGAEDIFRQVEQVADKLADVDGIAAGASSAIGGDTEGQALASIKTALSTVFRHAGFITHEIGEQSNL